MNKEFFRKIYKLLPKPLCELCLKAENAIIYIFYGALTTAVNFIAHFGLRFAFTDIPEETSLFDALALAEEHSRISSTAAAAIAWILAVLFAFFTNKYFVFEKKQSSGMLRELFGFTAGRLFSFGCEQVMMYAFVEKMHLNELFIKVLASIVVLILNYFISKLIVFRDKKNKDEKN